MASMNKLYQAGLSVIGGFIMAYVVDTVVSDLGFTLISSGVTDALVLVASIALVFSGISALNM